MSLSDDEFMRYSRHLLMDDIGEEGQQRLKSARVLIVGFGGLGCPVATYLVAAGVGSVDLCDADHVDKTNLQRQVLFREKDCGELKVICAKRQLEALNSGVEINVYAINVNSTILRGNYSLVIDCTDNIKARQFINQHCHTLGIPLVSAAAIGWEGQLVAFDYRQHKQLCFSCIVDQDTNDPVKNCSNSGVLGPILGVMGSMQAATAIRILLGFFQQHGDIHRYDGKRGQWLATKGVADSNCPVCGPNTFRSI